MSGRQGRPILAARFKTKECGNFVLHGSCPYGDRCMFAHGDHELRTKAQNVADDIITESAIKAFQRARVAATTVLLTAQHLDHHQAASCFIPTDTASFEQFPGGVPLSANGAATPPPTPSHDYVPLPPSSAGTSPVPRVVGAAAAAATLQLSSLQAKLPPPLPGAGRSGSVALASPVTCGDYPAHGSAATLPAIDASRSVCDSPPPRLVEALNECTPTLVEPMTAARCSSHREVLALPATIITTCMVQQQQPHGGAASDAGDDGRLSRSSARTPPPAPSRVLVSLSSPRAGRLGWRHEPYGALAATS